MKTVKDLATMKPMERVEEMDDNLAKESTQIPNASSKKRKGGTAQKKTVAIAIACDGCRRRKVKCNRNSNEETCALCTQKGIPCIEPTGLPTLTNPEDQSNKRKRQQYSACDSCRSRRVRCVREENNQRCNPCLKKSIDCTSLFISSVKQHPPKRSGNLIQYAKLIYGNDLNTQLSNSTATSTSGPDESSTSSPGEYDQSSASSSASTTVGFYPHPNLPERYKLFKEASEQQTTYATPLMSLPTPTESVMVHTTIETALTSHLLFCYHETAHQHMPFFDWSLFNRRFESFENRPHLMDTNSEALCSVLMAFGARVTDSPMVLSDDAPKAAEIPNLIFSGVDLSSFGKKRDVFCEHMTKKAFTKVKDADILTKPSIDSIITLTLLITITGGEGGRYDTSEMNPRIFGVALFEHFRQLLNPRDRNFQTNFRILTGSFRLAVMRDSLFAALNGRTLQATDEDLELYWPEILLQRSTSFTEPLNQCLKDMKIKEVTRKQLFSTPWESQSASNMFGKMIMEARMVSKLISGPVASQRSRVDLAYVRNHIWKDVDATVTWILSYSLMEKEKRSKSVQWLRGLALWRHILIQSVDLGLKNHYDNVVARENASDHEYLNDLGVALLESSRRLFGSLRQVVQSLKKTTTRMPFGSGGLFYRQICVCYEMMIKVASEEDGGIKGWTLEKKIEDLHYLCNALKEKGWSMAESAHHVSVVEQAIGELKERLASQGRTNPPPLEEIQTHGSVAVSSQVVSPSNPVTDSVGSVAAGTSQGYTGVTSRSSLSHAISIPATQSIPLHPSPTSAQGLAYPRLQNLPHPQGFSTPLFLPPSESSNLAISSVPSSSQSYRSQHEATALSPQSTNPATLMANISEHLSSLPPSIQQALSTGNFPANLPPQLLASLSSQPNLLPPSLQSFLPQIPQFFPVPSQDLPSNSTSFFSDNDVLAPFLSSEFDWQSFSLGNQ